MIVAPRPPWARRVHLRSPRSGWAALYYAIAVLAPAIAAETGWRRDAVMGGYTLALFAQAAAALPAGAGRSTGSAGAW